MCPITSNKERKSDGVICFGLTSYKLNYSKCVKIVWNSYKKRNWRRNLICLEGRSKQTGPKPYIQEK